MKAMQVRAIAGAVVGAGLLVGGLGAQERKAPEGTLSDAQIESNVMKALGGAHELSSQNIQTTTTFGEVTISGTVRSEELRVKAENLVARAPGVKKVVDELTLGDAPAQTADGAAGSAQAPDGDAPELANMAPPEPQGREGQYPPDQQYGGAPAQQEAPGYAQQSQQPTYGQGQPQAGAPPAGYNNQSAPAYGGPGYPNGAPNQGGNQGYAQAGQAPAGYGNQNYGPGAPEYSNNQPSPDYNRQQPYPPQGRRPMYQQAPPPPPGYGQQAGQPVTVPPGALLRVRVNRGIDSQHVQPGTVFDGTVLNDVLADGAVAIPRGASVQGVVADAQRTKALSGEGQLALQLTSVSLGGKIFPLQSDVWHRVGADKTASTVDHAVGVGLLGAVVGAVAGGGKGAVVGAGVGAGVGVAASAGSPRGQVIVPPEAVLFFHTAAPVPVLTVSEGEMQRLAYAAGPGEPRRLAPGPRYYPSGGVIYGRPGYYPYGGVTYYGR